MYGLLIKLTIHSPPENRRQTLPQKETKLHHRKPTIHFRGKLVVEFWGGYEGVKGWVFRLRIGYRLLLRSCMHASNWQQAILGWSWTDSTQSHDPMEVVYLSTKKIVYATCRFMTIFRKRNRSDVGCFGQILHIFSSNLMFIKDTEKSRTRFL